VFTFVLVSFDLVTFDIGEFLPRYAASTLDTQKSIIWHATPEFSDYTCLDVIKYDQIQMCMIQM
jgi:hypothetical protein